MARQTRQGHLGFLKQLSADYWFKRPFTDDPLVPWYTLSFVAKVLSRGGNPNCFHTFFSADGRWSRVPMETLVVTQSMNLLLN
jgi:hypothetical protein